MQGPGQWLPELNQEGTLRGEMQNNQENMPEVTSRAQGTKKESGRNQLNSEKPRRKSEFLIGTTLK